MAKYEGHKGHLKRITLHGRVIFTIATLTALAVLNSGCTPNTPGCVARTIGGSVQSTNNIVNTNPDSAVLMALRKNHAELLHIKTSVKGIKSDVKEIKGDVSTLTDDVSGLKDDVSELRDDVSGLKTNVSGLKVDLSGLTADISEITVYMARLLRHFGLEDEQIASKE